MANFDPATFDPSALSDAEIAQYLGIQQPELDQTQEQIPNQGLGSRIISGFSGLENQNYGPLQGFGSGLLAGISRGLGAAGTRAAENQARMEQMILERQKQRNQLNLQATQNYRESLQKGRQTLLAEQRTAGNKPPPESEAERLKRIENESAARARGTAAGNPGSFGGASEEDVKLLADAIEQGNQPADTKGFYRLAGPVKAELQRRGFDFSSANKDWQAVQRSISTLNGAQQTRLRQAVETAYHSLDVIDQLSAELKPLIPRGQFKELNRAALIAARNGLFGNQAASVAQRLDAQIGDVASEIGNAYMGGNSPTDHALGLAQKNLNSNWSEQVLKDAVDLARKNLGIRRNSINNTLPLVPGSASSRAQRPPLESFEH